MRKTKREKVSFFAGICWIFNILWTSCLTFFFPAQNVLACFCGLFFLLKDSTRIEMEIFFSFRWLIHNFVKVQIIFAAQMLFTSNTFFYEKNFKVFQAFPGFCQKQSVCSKKFFSVELNYGCVLEASWNSVWWILFPQKLLSTTPHMGSLSEILLFFIKL